MADRTADPEVKTCCASFYQSDMVRLLLGDILHPGGLALTRYLGAAIELGPADRVLDVACGRGASAIHLAERFGCHVTGLDYGAENVAAARAHAAERGVGHLATFRQGDAEELPFGDGAFDALISECSFCAFPDKTSAAAEMARVLVPGGRLGLTDVTSSGPLPEEIESLLGWVVCVAGASTSGDYVTTLQTAGFAGFALEDQRDALLDMVGRVRRKLLDIELLTRLTKLDGSTNRSLAELDLDEGKELARRAVGLIEDGRLGHVLVAAKRRQ